MEKRLCHSNEMEQCLIFFFWFSKPNKNWMMKQLKKNQLLLEMSGRSYVPDRKRWSGHQHQPPNTPCGPAFHQNSVFTLPGQKENISLHHQYRTIRTTNPHRCAQSDTRRGVHQESNEDSGLTRLIRWGSLIRQRALQRGSLMAAPCFSSCVASPPSITAHPPALSIRSSNADPFLSPTPISLDAANEKGTRKIVVVASGMVWRQSRALPPPLYADGVCVFRHERGLLCRIDSFFLCKGLGHKPQAGSYIWHSLPYFSYFCV